MCDCMQKLDAKLAQHEVIVNRSMSLAGGPSRAVIETVRTDMSGRKPKRSTPNVIASYCPFCGVSYGDAAEHEEKQRC